MMMFKNIKKYHNNTPFLKYYYKISVIQSKELNISILSYYILKAEL